MSEYFVPTLGRDWLTHFIDMPLEEGPRKSRLHQKIGVTVSMNRVSSWTTKPQGASEEYSTKDTK